MCFVNKLSDNKNSLYLHTAAALNTQLKHHCTMNTIGPICYHGIIKPWYNRSVYIYSDKAMFQMNILSLPADQTGSKKVHFLGKKFPHHKIGRSFYFGKRFNWIFLLQYVWHSSEIRGLHKTLCPRETLQNLPYFMYKKNHVSSFFRFSFRATLYFYLMNALVYVDID